MKTIKYILLLSIILYFYSCEYDNYDGPTANYSGQLNYNGSPFNCDGNAAHGVFVFFQKGFGKVDGGTAMHIKEDGTYTQLLHKGDYKLTLRNYNYPFVVEEFAKRTVGYDSLAINLQGNMNQNFNVIPFYTIQDVSAELQGIDIVGKFKITPVYDPLISNRPKIVKARIYLSPTQMVNSATTCVGEIDLNIIGDATTEIKVPISAINYRTAYQHNYRSEAYYRVAIELEGIKDYYLFSEVRKMTGIPEEFNDVTKLYMKNYSTPFTTSQDMGGGFFASNDWKASNADMQGKMIDTRFGRQWMYAENWFGPSNLKGAIYQTMNLTAGKYIFLAYRGNPWDMTVKERGVLAISKGNNMSDWNTSDILVKSDLADPKNWDVAVLNLTLDTDTQISFGYIVNMPTGESNALGFTKFMIYKL